MKRGYRNLYDALPVFAQNGILTGYSAFLGRERYGREFKRYQSFLEESQWYARERLTSYQNEKLVKLIFYCYQHVPYYRKRMDELSIKPGDIRSIEDLTKMPLLTRNDIKENFSELLSDEFDMRVVRRGHTSGTTGSPLEICYDESIIGITYALLDRHYQWAGVKFGRFGDAVAVLRGNPIVPLGQNRPPFWRKNYLHNQILLSAFHMSTQNLPYYIEELRRFSPKVLDGYPSTLYVVAKFLKDRGEKIQLDAVISSSETLYDFQREIIEDSFSCQIFDYFAAAERVLFSSECGLHQGHHVAEEFGVIEVLGVDDKPVCEGEFGKLVATSLHNYAMPLIRYVTDDVSSLLTRNCECGRNLKLMADVTTKAEDLLTLADGRLVSPSVLTHPFKPLTAILASQIIQTHPDRLVIKVIAGPSYDAEDENVLIAGMKERLGESVKIEIEKVEKLERTPAGKFKWVISDVEQGI